VKWVIDNYAYLQNVDPSTICYNTDLVKGADIPKDWMGVLNPKFKGALLMTDPRANSSYLALLLVFQKNYGDSFLTRLAAQEPKLVPNGPTGANSVASGDAAVHLPSSRNSIGTLLAAKAPIQIVPR
jgi:iron(III) transport system substrate-binding protein